MGFDRKKRVAAVLAALPLGLGLLLLALRGDLMLPMLRHPFGPAIVLGVALLSASGGGFALLGLWLVQRFAPSERVVLRRVLSGTAAGIPFLVFILPALVVLLLAPVVFAASGLTSPEVVDAQVSEIEPLLRVMP